mmetsp:Transcript_37749/g.77544  ORF Transcript_37749/g.77544 Transcript_37749/m.77544 type:complete len:190 (+) Transcript_37749:159-728(+)|eukprot:CAMPEP_0181308600 /NCGR_PEP_ID=MMETSP1101-20121128/11554_1 /TAXON_ID=46948 /ORGANISM="Rhodomonas abbreviata, Strain Caron Lab Isolate" /LENGTH=189 /DNA_ID=CAMNT_0023415003 /DNA_START=155 /DNA_END=724 /DNA_ORIENTATION=+
MSESVFNPCNDIQKYPLGGECVPDIEYFNEASGRDTVGNWINRNAGPAVLHNIDLATAVRNILRSAEFEGSILSQTRVMTELRRQGISAEKEDIGWLVDREISRFVWQEQNGVQPEAGKDSILDVREAENIAEEVTKVIQQQKKQGGMVTQRRVIGELMARGVQIKGHESHITSIVDYELMSTNNFQYH